MRTPEQMIRDIELETLCIRNGKRHKFKRRGAPLSMFYDGKATGSLRLIVLRCERCGFEKMQEEMKVAK